MLINYNGPDPALDISGPFIGMVGTSPGKLEIEIEQYDPVFEGTNDDCIIRDPSPPNVGGSPDPASEVEDPTNNSPNNNSSSISEPRGTFFYDPECETCCHAPSIKPESLFKTIVLAVINSRAIESIKRGELDIVLKHAASKNPSSSGFQNLGIYSATLDIAEDARINGKKPSLIPIPFKDSKGIKSSSRAYKFIKKIIFPFEVSDVENLTIFTFIYLDPKEIRNAFPDMKKEDVIANSLRSKVRFLDIKRNGRYILNTSQSASSPSSPTTSVSSANTSEVTVPVVNVRHSEILDNILLLCSKGLYDSVLFNEPASTKAAFNSWISQTNPTTTTTIIGVDYLTMIKQNSFITSLATTDFYRAAKIKYLNINKVDVYDETRENLIANTQDSNDRILKKTSIRRDLDSGEAGIVSYVEEVNLNVADNRFFKIVDMYNNSKDFYYEIEFGVEDPSIKVLAKMGSIFNKLLEDNKIVYDKIDELRSGVSTTALVDVPRQLVQETIALTKKTIPRIISIIHVLAPSLQFDKEQIVNYLSMISSPKSSPDDHQNYIKILSTLYNTLASLLSGSKVLSQEMESYSTIDKLKAESIRVISYKTEARKPTMVGIEFIDPNIQLEISSFTGPLITKQQLLRRGSDELSKFWNGTPEQINDPNLPLLIQKAIFNLTPVKVYGMGNEIQLTKNIKYDKNHENDINDGKLLLEGKSIKNQKDSSKSSIESLDNILFSIQEVPTNFSLIEEIQTFSGIRQRNQPKKRGNNTPINQDNFLNVDNYDSKDLENKAENKTGLNSTFDEILESGLSTLLTKQSSGLVATNQKIEERSLETLLPSYQSYSLRNNPVSKFYKIPRFDRIDDPQNTTFVQNFMNLTVKIQTAVFKNLNEVIWEDLNTSNLDSNKIMLCRLLLIDDKELNIDNTRFEDKVYNQYFLLGQKGSIASRLDRINSSFQNLETDLKEETYSADIVDKTNKLMSSYHKTVFGTVSV